MVATNGSTVANGSAVLDNAKDALRLAQTHRAEAETRHLEALAKSVDAERNRAEAAHEAALGVLEAERRKAQAEADEAEIETQVARIAHEHSKITMARARREEDDELAQNRHHYVYELTDIPVVGGTIPAISDYAVNQLIEQLGKWHRQAGVERPGFEIILNTGGGDVNAGFALIDYVRWLREQGHEVTIRVLGMAASMGAIVLQSADRRIMGRNSVMMLHEASFGASGTYAQVKSSVELAEIYHERMFDILAERSEGKMSRRAIKDAFKKKTWWMPAQEALNKGFVDELA